ncbi:MAG TPA: L-threonylcarbamoyladenylate synthase [Solirubrobacteraceae bacterium]|jgi:L-threonylcarbamoyladenylate synthase|nr:L-threonylcarbamoyladenylate synthase [Solirubrobacteraceae bacterium]
MNELLEGEDAQLLEECLAGGGVAVFPAETVYGICCDPDDEQAAQRLYKLKGRPTRRACAVMWFALEPALQEIEHELVGAEERALRALLPGPVTVLLPNRSARFAAACRTDRATLGLRVPRLPAALAGLGTVTRPLMQTSANLSGEPDARKLPDVPESIRAGADLVLDGGELPGTPSSVIDLRDFAATRRWHMLREGALAAGEAHALLDAVD